MSSVFPLLNSPHLVISEVFNMLEFHELVTMSLCSRKTNSLIKFNWTKPEKLKILMISSCFKSSVGFDYGTISKDLLSVREKTNESVNLKKLETVEMDGYKLPITTHKDHCLLYWNDEQLGLKKTTQYLCNLFKTNINELVIGKSGLWTINWINDNQKKPLPNAYIHQDQTLSEEEYFKVLTECKVTDILAIHASAPESFRFPSNLLPKVDCLIVTQGQWMTSDHLLSMDCKAFAIERTKFNSSEINKFIRNWLNFKCLQLEYLYIQTEISINRLDVLKGLKYIRLDEKQIFKMRDGRPCTFILSYDVKRSDGVTASINCNRDLIAMFVKNN